ncbi:MAG: spike base protein, RCAP_Rcc01079 family [Novosphingobium sp.]|uniref:spike base protein, RCAP_Rcc01079 family n=1 Tax=Novosphingobium sp. TaxID=1874826 RepID=UPI003B9CF464
MEDPFLNTVDSPMTPAGTCFPITPHDTVEFERATKAVYVGTGGDLVLRSVNGTADVTFRNLPAGFILDVRVRAIRLTGTTAADLVGLA